MGRPRRVLRPPGSGRRPIVTGGLVAGLVAAALLAGCASAPSVPSADSPAREAAAALAAMDPYADLVGAAEAVLVARCVRDRGLPMPGEPVAEPDPQILAALAPPTPQAAAEVGYAIAPRVLVAPTPADRQAWVDAGEPARAAATEALFGDRQTVVTVTFDDGYTAQVGAAGCFADVRRSLYGDLTEYTRRTWVASQASGRVVTALADNSSWADGTAAWADCMAGAGSPYRSAGQIRADLFGERGAVVVDSAADRWATYQTLRDRERGLAELDARCAEQAGLREIWVTAVAAADRDYLERHHDDIVSWSQYLIGRADGALAQASAAAA